MYLKKNFMKKALLYNPYLDVMGGGERHVLSVMEILQEEGFHVDIAWDDDTILDKLRNQLRLHLIDFRTVKNVFKKNLSKERNQLTRKYDIFLYVTDGSYFVSHAKKNYIFSMYPDASLYTLSLLNWFKTRKYEVIANGDFTAQRIKGWMKLKSHVLYPYIDQQSFDSTSKKSQTIISVGRIFKHLHSKRHDIILQAFIQLKKTYKEYQHFTLEILGGMKEEDREYFEELKLLADGREDIAIHPNISHDDLRRRYSTALVYWHAGGYGIDENVHPENVEHVGITPLEAMASGCITFCYNAGGPKLYIKDGINGYLYSSIEELIDKTHTVLGDPKTQDVIRKNAHALIEDTFTYSVFKNSVKKIFTL